VLFCQAPDTASETDPARFPAHSARYDDFHAQSSLVMCVANEQSGAPAILTSREATKELDARDPRILNGVVRDRHVRERHGIRTQP
jgi:hypothetical protein